MNWKTDELNFKITYEMNKKNVFCIVFIALLSGINIVHAQNISVKDSVKSKPEEKEIRYSGVKMEGISGKNTISGSYDTDVNERVINDTELTYSGEWEFNRLLPRHIGYFCNTRSFAKQDGATANYRFSDCEGVVWYAKPVQNGARADVYIDHRLIKEIDCSQVNPEGVLFDSGPLERGEHQLTIVAKSGAVEIDRIVSKGKIENPVRIDCGNRSFIQYTAGFRITPASLDTPFSLAVAEEEDEEWEFYCKGPSIRCFGETGPNGGIMRLYVNDIQYKDIHFYSNKKASRQLLFELKNLPSDRFNRIKGVVVSKRGKITIESFTIADPACLMVEMNRLTDEEIAKMGRHETTASDPAGWKPVAMGATPPLNGVSLGDGIFRTIFDRNIAYLKDCLHKPHWVDAKDADRIWIDILMGSNEGRMLGGMGHSLRYKDIPEFHKAIDEIIEEIDRRQYANGNGYMMPYESSNYKISTETWPYIMRDEQKNYDRAMLTKGLLAAGLAGHEKSYRILRPFYNWYNNAKEYLPLMLLGSMGIQGSIAGPMVYHSPIGKPEDIQTNMKYYDMKWWLDMLAQGLPEAAWRFTLNRPHNYLLTSICALFDIYKATGEQRYLDACLGAWKIYSEYFQTPGGGISLCEHFECKPKSYKLSNIPNSVYETCGNVFWVDLNHRLLQLWPEKDIYAAHIEQSLYNIVFAAQAENGNIRYFNQMNHSKYPSFNYNTCCEIQATSIYGMLPQYIYSRADDGVYVNLFAASEYDFSVNNQQLKITMNTTFPYAQEVSLQISASSPVNTKIRIRIPHWVAGDVEMKINGKKAGKTVPGSYVTLERTWKDGDIVTWQLPMTWKAEKYRGETRMKDATRYAFSYGPILMALKGPLMQEALQGEDEPSIRLDMTPETLIKKIQRTDKSCEFTIEGAPGYSFTPYFSLQEGSFTCFPGLNKSPDTK